MVNLCFLELEKEDPSLVDGKHSDSEPAMRAVNGKIISLFAWALLCRIVNILKLLCKCFRWWSWWTASKWRRPLLSTDQGNCTNDSSRPAEINKNIHFVLIIVESPYAEAYILATELFRSIVIVMWFKKKLNE